MKKTLSIVLVLFLLWLIGSCNDSSPSPAATTTTSASVASATAAASVDARKPAALAASTAQSVRQTEQPTVGRTATPSPTIRRTATPSPTIRRTATPKPNSASSCTYVLNRNTKKFHKPSCSSVRQMKAKNRINFTGTREEVLQRGYAPCKNCNP
ncbi:MAG: Ada metal-binding domain-containing protein [bacterium]|nr:Ada metal-binding domain-containing protein [bacterium]